VQDERFDNLVATHQQAQAAMNPYKHYMLLHVTPIAIIKFVVIKMHLIGATGWSNRLQAVAAAFDNSHGVHIVHEKLVAQSGSSCLPMTAELPVARSQPSVP
jgi:hypothetical protein